MKCLLQVKINNVWRTVRKFHSVEVACKSLARLLDSEWADKNDFEYQIITLGGFKNEIRAY